MSARPNRVLTIAVAVMILALSGFGFWRQRSSGEASRPRMATLSVSPLRALVVLPDDGPDAILSELRAATTSIDLYVYLLPSDDVLAILGKAHDRSVKVRVILDRDPFGGGNSNQDAYDQLKAMGISVKWAPQDFQFSHIKMFVVDARTAVIMTLNLSYSALHTNREFAVVSTETDDVAGAQSIFDADWSGATAIIQPGMIVSPVNSRASLLSLIRSAKTSVDIYAEVVADDEIRDTLKKVAQAGITVRIIVPADPAPDDVDVYRDLVQAGIQVRLLADVYSHAKAVIVDQSSAFIGSQNFTFTSLDRNRELGVILIETANLQRLNHVFASDWQASPEFSADS